MSKQKYSYSDAVFLLGAGASVDAGMPTVKDLTDCLSSRLSNNTDKSLKAIYDLLSGVDKEVKDNYERLFEYIYLIRNLSILPNCIGMSDNLIETIKDPFFIYIISNNIKDILEEYQKKAIPDYLLYLKDFIPENGRLKVFTLNYDLCIETAFKNSDIFITTGFDHNWKPLLFNSTCKGINLYKLHGSISWYTENNWGIIESQTLLEKSPELVGGPFSKIQADDPFLTLFYEFHRALQEAKVCIVIGYSYQDKHINTVLEKAKCQIIDVNKNPHNIFPKIYKSTLMISGTTKEVFEKDEIKTKLSEIIY